MFNFPLLSEQDLFLQVEWSDEHLNRIYTFHLDVLSFKYLLVCDSFCSIFSSHAFICWKIQSLSWRRCEILNLANCVPMWCLPCSSISLIFWWLEIKAGIEFSCNSIYYLVWIPPGCCCVLSIASHHGSMISVVLTFNDAKNLLITSGPPRSVP